MTFEEHKENQQLATQIYDKLKGLDREGLITIKASVEALSIREEVSKIAKE